MVFTFTSEGQGAAELVLGQPSLWSPALAISVERGP